MIVVVAKATLKPGVQEAAAAAMKTMAEASLKEPGCRTYAFYIDINDPTALITFEEWESAENMPAHFSSPHMAALGAQLPTLLASPVMLTQYEVSSSSTSSL